MRLNARDFQWSTRRFCWGLLALFAVGLASCDVDPGVDDVRYPCTASGQCGEGYECRLDPGLGEKVCVPAGTTFDASADAAADALDGTDGADADCDGGTCFAPPTVITLNTNGPLRETTIPPTIKADGEGGVLVAGVFDRCLTLQTDVACEEATERSIVAEGVVTAFDGFVLHLDERTEVQALHKITVGINALALGYNASLMTTDIAPLTGGEWVVGGTNWDDELTYNDSQNIGAPDVPSGVSDDHHRWLVRSGDDTVDWGHRSGYAGHEYLAALDANASDEIASSGVFAQRYYRHPQDADGEWVESYALADDSEDFAQSGLVEVWNPDGTIHSALRIQSGYDVFTGAVALSDARQVAVFAEFRDTMDVYYDVFDSDWTAFSDTETLTDYVASDTSGTRQSLIVHDDASQEPLVLEMGSRGSIDVWDARFDSNGDLVAAGQFGSDVDFGGGNVSVGGFDSSSFLARWDPSDLSLKNLVTFDSDDGDDGFWSLAQGPNGGDLVAGEFSGRIDYGQETIESVAATDSIVAEFGPDGELLWYEVFSGAGYVYAIGAATMGEGRVAVLVEAENEMGFRDTSIGQDGVVTTHIVVFDPPTQQ